MDSTEFTNQLVNFAGVEQQINSNSKLDNLVAMNAGSAFSSALNYVGKNVNYVSAETTFDGASPVDFKYAITGGTPSTIKVNILNEEGDLVYTKKISSLELQGDFTWDGKNKGGSTVESGTYTIRVDALDANNKSLSSTTVVNGYARGIETQNGNTMLLVGDRAVSIGTIINVTEPAKSTTTTDNTTTTSSTTA